MAKMEDDKVLGQLRALEDDSAAYTWGRLGKEREAAMRAYYRMPYGNEEPGWSSIVTSEVQDTVEWVLPALLKIFTTTDRAVSFDPTRADEVPAAEQATDACNYVFYKQNNGFLVLYTAFKDALTVRNCAVMWRKEKTRVRNVTPVKGASPEMLAMVLEQAGKDADIESATPSTQPMMGPGGPVIDPATGQPAMQQVFDARIVSYTEKEIIKVEAFPPEDLLIKRDWVSPLLGECPYVSRIMRVTLSDLHEMGYDDVTAEELAGSDDAARSADAEFRAARAGTTDSGLTQNPQVVLDDESLTEGYLRIEYVLMDYDGDGIAERRCIHRLKNKILSNEEVDDVPFATASPLINPHRWDGLSLADCVQDLQELGTELTRQMLNSAYLANNPRTKVLTDSNWSPMANIDDLLDSRPGAVLRQKQPGAIEEHTTPWAGGQMFPMLEHVQAMGERRTGVSPLTQVNPNALQADRTAKEVQITANAAAARIELVARIFAEILLKPIFKGVLKLLTSGEMETIAFRLRGQFIECDPQEWRDSYDMTVHVGLGTGDKELQAQILQSIFQAQGAIGPSPVGSLLIKPKNIYNTLAKMVENAGFKNVGDFYQDPGDAPMPQQPPPGAGEAQAKIAESQARMQADAQMHAQELSQKAQLHAMDVQQDAALQKMKAEYQAMVDQNRQRSEAEQQQAKISMEAQLAQLRAHYDDLDAQREDAFNRWKAQLEAATKIEVANIMSQAKVQDSAVAASGAEITNQVQG